MQSLKMTSWQRGQEIRKSTVKDTKPSLMCVFFCPIYASLFIQSGTLKACRTLVETLELSSCRSRSRSSNWPQRQKNASCVTLSHRIPPLNATLSQRAAPWLDRKIHLLPSVGMNGSLCFVLCSLTARTVIFHENPGMFGVTLSNLVLSPTNGRLWGFFSTLLSVTRCSTNSHLRLSNVLSHCWGLQEADGCWGISLYKWKENVLQMLRTAEFVGFITAWTLVPFCCRNLTCRPFSTKFSLVFLLYFTYVRH